MTRSDGPKLWLNRLLSFGLGGLIVLIVMAAAAVAPVKSENAALTKKLDELQFGATRLLSEAKAYVASQSYGNAQSSLQDLFAKHPDSSAAIEGKKLYAEIQTTVAQQDQRWAAASAAVKSEWEKSTAAKLRADADAVRQGVEAAMASTLSSQWEQSKDKIRQEWEKGEI